MANFILLQSEVTGMLTIYLIFSVLAFGIVVLIFRLVGAWTFRINDVISHQKEILAELKKLNSRNDQ